MKSNSNIKPPIILELGDGSFHYNYNIKEVEMPRFDIESRETQIGYDYDTVHVWGGADYDKIVRVVIRSIIDENDEFNFVNKYNSFQLGLSDDDSYKTRYVDYLNTISEIKDMVKTDLEIYKAQKNG